MNRTRRWLSIAPCCLLAGSLAAAPSSPIELKGKLLDCTGEQAILSFSLKNLAPQAIDISTHDLPWTHDLESVHGCR